MTCARKMSVQTLIFPRDSYTRAQARAWARSHGYRAQKVHCSASSCRVRQSPPSRFCRGTFRTITFGRGIKAVIGKRRI